MANIKYTEPSVQLEKVRENGQNLQFCVQPSAEVLMEAIKQNPYAIRFINAPTEEHIVYALTKNPYAILYIRNSAQTAEFILKHKNLFTLGTLEWVLANNSYSATDLELIFKVVKEKKNV